MVNDICFENVKFRYGTRVEVFSSLDIRIHKGEITAVVGESGSGKTTLASLLQNLYPLQDGHIWVGGYDLQHFTNKSLRKVVSVVPQKIDLFAGDVINNIAIGEINPDMGEILAVCEKLGMIKFIERALYRNPEVLILDEATSSLDSFAESFVQNTLKMLRDEGRTVIVIAHRLSTISLADRIIVLDNGTVIQEGTFSELSAMEGHFRKMWMHQAIEFEEVKT